ncbi:hypothetical protein Q7P37_004059 [Cladosporium fusiforme]
MAGIHSSGSCSSDQSPGVTEDNSTNVIKMTFGIELEFLVIHPDGCFAQLELEGVQSAVKAVAHLLNVYGVPTKSIYSGPNMAAPRFSRWNVDLDNHKLTDAERAHYPPGHTVAPIEISSRKLYLCNNDWQEELRAVLDAIYSLRDFGCLNEQATFKAELEKLQSENAVLRQEIMSRQMASDTKLPHSPLDSQGASAGTSNTEDDSENSTSANSHAEESQKDGHEAHGQDEDAGEISKASQPVLSAVETDGSSATDDSTHESTELGDKSEQIDGNEGENFTLSTPDAHEHIKTNHDAALGETVSETGEFMPICGTNATNEVNDGNRQACEQNTELAIDLDQTDRPLPVDAETCELAGDNAHSETEPCSEPAHDQDEVDKPATSCAIAEDSDYVGEANGDNKDQDEDDNGTGSHTTPDDGDDERDTDSESKKVNENNNTRRIHQSAWAWSKPTMLQDPSSSCWAVGGSAAVQIAMFMPENGDKRDTDSESKKGNESNKKRMIPQSSWAWSTPTMLQDPSSSCWAVGGSAAVQVVKTKKSLAKLPKSDDRTLTTGIWHHRVHLQYLERLGCLKRLVKQLAIRKHNLRHEQKPKAFVRLPDIDCRNVPTGIPHHQERFRYLEEQHAKGIKQPYLIPNTSQSMQTAPDMVKGLHYNPTERGERGGAKVQQKKKNAKNKQDRAQDGSAARHLPSAADAGQSNAPPKAPTAPLAFRAQVSFQAAQHAASENAPTGPRLEQNHASTAPLAPGARAGFLTAQHAAPENAPTCPRLERNRAYIASNSSEVFAASSSATLHAAPENAPTGPRQDHTGNASEKPPSLAESKFAPRHGAAHKTHFKNQRKN